MAFGEAQEYCKDVWAPLGLSFTSFVITSLLTLVTAPGNLLICIAILKDPNKELKTSFNYLLMNIALSDLVVGAVSDPINMLFAIREALGYRSLSFTVTHLSIFIGCTSSLLSVALLAVERAITVHASYRKKLPKKQAILLSIGIWVFSISFPFIYLYTGYYIFAFIFHIMVAFVTLVIVTSFLSIQRNVRNRVFVNGTEANQSSSNTTRKIQFEERVTKIFKAILIFHCICNIPSFIFTLIVNLCGSCDCYFIHWSRDILKICLLINCGGNQFLYAWRTKSFTRAFRSLLRLPVTFNNSQATSRTLDISATQARID